MIFLSVELRWGKGGGGGGGGGGNSSQSERESIVACVHFICLLLLRAMLEGVATSSLL